MKTLLVIKKQEYEWLIDLFPGVHPLLVPICNKPFIEFLVDFAILAGSDALRIVSDGVLGDVEHYCENGSRWGVEISYGSMRPGDDISTVIDKNRRFCLDGRVIIISGFLFIRYNKKREYASLFASLPTGELLGCPHGSISLAGTSTTKTEAPGTLPFSLAALDSIGKYYELSMEILRTGLTHYVIPGYSSEEDCYIGRNVIIPKSAEIIKPVIIGNNVQIMTNAIIDRNSVIGSNVIIDRESVICSSKPIHDLHCTGIISGQIWNHGCNIFWCQRHKSKVLQIIRSSSLLRLVIRQTCRRNSSSSALRPTINNGLFTSASFFHRAGCPGRVDGIPTICSGNRILMLTATTLPLIVGCNYNITLIDELLAIWNAEVSPRITIG